MRLPSLVLAAWVATAPAAWGQQAPGQTMASQSAPLTLAAALRRAEEANPLLRSKLAERAGAEGALRDAHSLIAYNPQLQWESTRRQVPPTAGSDAYREGSAGIAQTLEIAGQPGFRRATADAALQALELEIADLRLQQRAEVGRRFYKVLALQQRVEVETRAASLFDDAAKAVERRRAAGEDTRLDANIALVEAERARNQAAATREQLLEARAALAVPLQTSAGELPNVEGSLEESQALPYTQAQLLDGAWAQPRLRALAARQRSTESRVQLERAKRVPDVTLGLSAGREGAAEHLTTFTLSVPIPLFRRNASGIGSALTEAEQASIARQQAEHDVPTQVRALWLRLESLRQRVERYQRAVLPALSRNEELSAKSRRAGQIGLLEQLVAQRQVLDARRDLLDAQLEYLNTRLTLEATAGWPPQP